VITQSQKQKTNRQKDRQTKTSKDSRRLVTVKQWTDKSGSAIQIYGCF